MTLPRVLSLRTVRDGIRLVQKPVTDVQKLRQKTQRFEGISVSPGQNLLSDIKGDTFDIECELEIGNASEIGFKLRKSEHEETVVAYNAVTQSLFIDRSDSGEKAFHEAFGCRHDVALQTENGRLKLHLFVDQSSVEVFANDGEIAITDQIFPDPNSTGLELYVHGGSMKVISLSIHALKSIYSVATV